MCQHKQFKPSKQIRGGVGGERVEESENGTGQRVGHRVPAGA